MRPALRSLRACIATVRAAIRTPADALLLIEMAAFIARISGEARRSDVPSFFRRLARARRPKAATLERGFTRIVRLRGACLAMPRLWRRDTCYVRALTLYRFLDAGDSSVRVHFGVEEPSSKSERLRGHAWVSVDGRMLEGPDAVREQRIREVPLDVAY